MLWSIRCCTIPFAMILVETQYTGAQVLQAFYHDAPFLFLGSAFITVGVVSIGFCALRRRFDALLVWLGIFAALYGLRMWMQSDLGGESLQANLVLQRLRLAITYLIPIPAFNFFAAAGFLGGGAKRARSKFVVRAIFVFMFAATLVVGPWHVYDEISGGIVTVVLWIIVVRSLRKKEKDRDFKAVRIGVLSFVAFALWDNLAFRFGIPSHIEPYGFAILLASLGYVAARRTLERDVELVDIHRELELARRIQLSILPGDFPGSTDFRVAARYVPMASVAGDLYDFLVAGDRKAGLLIADVSGHGIPAALIASMVKMAAVSQRDHAAQPAQVLTEMNAALCGNTQGQFVTAAYVYLDAVARELRYSAAGHPAMLLLRGHAVTEIAENGLLLAAAPSETYSDKTLPLEAGDRLVLYTDGLVEARNEQGELFGEERFNQALGATAGLTPDAAADQLIAAAQQWAKSQDDDLTVLVCDYVDARAGYA
jgi:sigma-B regulation protein RsbU (phosphoserine phosphatase)